MEHKLSESRIVCAAIMDDDGNIIAGARHFDRTMHKTIENSNYTKQFTKQGFIDQHGAFFDREEALIIAKKQNQIYRDYDAEATGLFSENLY